MATSSNGAFRYVNIYDAYVVKTALTNREDYDEDDWSCSEATPEECLDSQANELGTWHDFRNNGALCPIIEEKSSLEAIYMERALTEFDTTNGVAYSDYAHTEIPWIQITMKNLGVSEFCTGRIETAVAFGIALGEALGIDINYNKFISGLTEIYNKSREIFYNIVEDLHIHNVGIYGNDLVIIDYAGCEHIYDYNEEGVIYA